ncbi:VOC family protein [Colwelliaceae bacterium 6441]
MQKLRFHHVGIPTDRKLSDVDYNDELKFHGQGYFDNPYGIEWHNFDEDNQLNDIIKTRPHVGFVVDDLEEAIKGKEVLLAPTSPTEGVVVAFILDGENLIELLQFNKPEQEVWPHPNKFKI